MQENESFAMIVDLLEPVVALSKDNPSEASETIQRCLDAAEIARSAMRLSAGVVPEGDSTLADLEAIATRCGWIKADGKRAFEFLQDQSYLKGVAEGKKSSVQATEYQGFNLAINFAIEQGSEAAQFLSAWREGDVSEWPGFSMTADGNEFTDFGRAAIAWVLWHHQGASSPIGQPLRFALGLGAHDQLPSEMVELAKQWAKKTGSTTEEFHRPGSMSREAPVDIVFIKQVLSVAIAGLYEHYKEDVLRVFTLDDLQTVIDLSEPLRPQQVEDIYKRAWDQLNMSPWSTGQQEVVRCPQKIIDAITAYGDARADQDANNAPTASHMRLAECIRLIRGWLASQSSPAEQSCLCKDKCLHTGMMGQCKGLPSVIPSQAASRVVDCHSTGVCVQSGLRAERPAQQQEPIGYWDGFFDADGLATVSKFKRVHNSQNAPLYTSPQPAHQQQRRPSDADLIRCWIEKPSGEIDGIASMRKVLEKFGSAPQPANHEMTSIERHERNLGKFLEEPPAMTNQVFMCHMDIDEGCDPDPCVLDGGNIQDCVYAKRYGLEAKTKCGEWKPIVMVQPVPRSNDGETLPAITKGGA